MVLPAETSVMKTKFLALAAVLLLVPLSTMAAESPLQGIWLVETASLDASRNHAFVVHDGVYSCLSCSPSYSIPADGAFHAIPAGPTRDELAVLVINPQEVQISERKDGLLVSNAIHRVSDSGASKHVEYQDHTGKQPVVSRFVYARMENPPDGAHAISGAWVATRYEHLSNSGRFFTLAVNGNRLRMSNPQGQGFEAVMDGSRAVFTGSPIVTSVSVMQLARHRIRVTYFNDGQVVGKSTYHVLPNGVEMKVSYENPVDGSELAYTARLQHTILDEGSHALGGGIGMLAAQPIRARR